MVPDLSHLAVPGARIAVRVTPKASRARIEPGEPLRVYVTVAPEGGKANAAVRKLLAKALGLATSRLRLVRGETSREKLFEVG
ncbi:DUF167 domain-containing protein [Pseudoroseicyclus tamaricis]|uniref:UPF0235 protein GZA08_14560 n=1 Tax=Pseudoroseicyclus tamaricis TaxID=2705421 RepID=A0A6B2JZV3_9RHOB|nr:DUF167 domain-containing protein [Pseudoroseicyclus tamaricis]NDV02189.1 DUF167 domain-containing protein [Pseudoroseicyclus tamaricis]